MSVVFEVVVAPVRGPQARGLGVTQAGYGEAGPVGSQVLAPRRPAFADGQMEVDDCRQNRSCWPLRDL
jgi:hypothetical protein